MEEEEQGYISDGSDFGDVEPPEEHFNLINEEDIQNPLDRAQYDFMFGEEDLDEEFVGFEPSQGGWVFNNFRRRAERSACTMASGTKYTFQATARALVYFLAIWTHELWEVLRDPGGLWEVPRDPGGPWVDSGKALGIR